MKRILDNLIPPSSGQRFVALDGLRAMAIMGVLVGHAAVWNDVFAKYLIRAGGVGVTTFFVLSGFLLYYPVIKKRSLPRLRDYFARRFLRIYPAYVIATVVTILVIPEAREAGLSATVASLFLFQNLKMQWSEAINPYMWFLASVVQFYLLFPLLAWVSSRKPYILPALVILAMLIQNEALYPPRFPKHLNWPFLALPFLCGMLTAQLAVRRPRRIAGTALIGLVGLFVHAFFLRWLVADNPRLLLWIMRGPIICSFAALAVLGLSSASGFVSHCLSVRPVRVLAVASYGAYLFHYQIWALSHTEESRLASALLMIVLSILVGISSYLYVEAPVMRFARKRMLHRPQEAQASVNPSPPGSSDGT